MNVLTAIDVSFVVTSVNKETNQIIVRPYSTLYKNAPESYPTYWYDLSIFDPSQDLNMQIAKLITPIVQQTVQRESTNCSSLLDSASELLNTTITVTVSTDTPVPPQILKVDNTPADMVLNQNINFVA
jgi:hypothetical protein